MVCYRVFLLIFSDYFSGSDDHFYGIDFEIGIFSSRGYWVLHGYKSMTNICRLKKSKRQKKNYYNRGNFVLFFNDLFTFIFSFFFFLFWLLCRPSVKINLSAGSYRFTVSISMGQLKQMFPKRKKKQIVGTFFLLYMF